MFKVEVVFQQRFNRSSLFGYVPQLPDFKSKTLVVYQDEQMTQAVIVKSSQVDHYKTIEVIENDVSQKKRLHP